MTFEPGDRLIAHDHWTGTVVRQFDRAGLTRVTVRLDDHRIMMFDAWACERIEPEGGES